MTTNLPTPAAPLRIGTRGSPLALAQARETRARLMAAWDLPEDAFEIVVIKTTGDDRSLIDADVALKELGGKGLFTKEIEEDMLTSSIDIAVHSMKDMPTVQPDGLMLDCYLPREDVRDAFVSVNHDGLHALPEGAIVGSSSLRRRAQLFARRPDLNVVEFRGNVQTRMKKLGGGVADATFLAMAGLRRLGMEEVVKSAIEVEDMLPAVAQGAIGIERRVSDTRAGDMLAAIHNTETGQRLAAERSFLKGLDGSCQTPIAALAELDGGTLRLRGEILRPDGSEVLTDDRTAPIEDGAALGADMARDLRARAGDGFFDWH
ncbi:hydroxymethylbilane synthase [Jannaschia sp. CCS1]|uniref:hydroxymethylbilane synthase n=1 Tax=Jannaschia sp. (strain CCS1) TaxID=290400 RepID=UPI0000539FAB|nr:hydroxymethylbilane synthase [Jannaschia sp. CCS1]ABD56762.1 porphobilinogen deaminase [Jannaschia sp. CCS1]